MVRHEVKPGFCTNKFIFSLSSFLQPPFMREWSDWTSFLLFFKVKFFYFHHPRCLLFPLNYSTFKDQIFLMKTTNKRLTPVFLRPGGWHGFTRGPERSKSMEQSSLIMCLHRVSAASKQFNCWVQPPVLVSRWCLGGEAFLC